MSSAHSRSSNTPGCEPACRSRQAGSLGPLRWWRVPWVLPGLLLCFACAPVELAPVQEAVVQMTNRLTFEPKEIMIPAGKTVEWKNLSLLVHTVTADPELAARKESVILPEGASPFDSGNILPEGIFRHRFTVPGRYQYFCLPHEGAGMVGTVVVTSVEGSPRSVSPE